MQLSKQSKYLAIWKQIDHLVSEVGSRTSTNPNSGSGVLSTGDGTHSSNCPYNVQHTVPSSSCSFISETCLNASFHIQEKVLKPLHGKVQWLGACMVCQPWKIPESDHWSWNEKMLLLA